MFVNIAGAMSALTAAQAANTAALAANVAARGGAAGRRKSPPAQKLRRWAWLFVRLFLLVLSFIAVVAAFAAIGGFVAYQFWPKWWPAGSAVLGFPAAAAYMWASLESI